MRLADAIGLEASDRGALFYALLMKDAGCSSNAARFASLFAADDQQLKPALKTIDWSHALESFAFVARSVAPGQFWLRRVWQALAVFAKGPAGAREVVQTRCERGADIARMLGFTETTASAVRALDEHWDGRGQPYGLRGHQIPILARILGLAQTMEVFVSTAGVERAYDVVRARRSTWFDPSLAAAALSFRRDHAFWTGLDAGDVVSQLTRVEPPEQVVTVDSAGLDRIAEAFALVIDAKSPWTYQHSTGVARVADAVAMRLGLTVGARQQIRRAALLHDLGKLGVSNLILDKPARLTDDEMAVMRRHTADTFQILTRVGCFRELATSAAAHHERIDGQGYHQGLAGPAVPLLARVLCTADICDALSASRPYREGLPPERVLDILRKQIGTAIDPDCYQALQDVLTDTPDPRIRVPAARVVAELSEDYHQAA